MLKLMALPLRQTDLSQVNLPLSRDNLFTVTKNAYNF